MKKDLLFAVIAIAAVGGVCFGLAEVRPAYKPTPSEPYQLGQHGAGLAPVAPGNVVMRVNGEPVTDQQFQMYVSGMPENVQRMTASAEGRRLIADQIVSLIALAQEGRKMGLDRDPESTMRLQAEATNELAMKALNNLTKPNEAALRAQYEQKKSGFESIELKHILIAYRGGQVPPRPGTQALSVDEAMKKAKSLEAQLRGGQDFGLVARAISDDVASARQDGNIGAVGRQSLPPDVASVVFAMKPGEISGPLKTSFGIHIFLAGARKLPTFEEVRSELEAEGRQLVARETVDKIKKSADIYLDPSFFGSTKSPKGSPKNPA